ncbi:hypothetical protein KFK09_026447 [Dendrobium nobile]|uniref:Apoptosis inhibitor 5 n=1 Tax=Dendrobium nobile TaxID=94219 RepID=A0A8T3A893_DENNO|nr:hypothetical protein KFK09_026447 [Dendrobium nobile]
MGAVIGDAKEVEKLYEYGERLNEAKDKAQHVSDYEGILNAVKSGSTKAKQLAAQLIPRFFKFFPELDKQAISAQFDLVEEEELAVTSLTALFKHVEIGMENIREKVIAFLKEKVFPLKAELLKPQVEMERRVTDLVKKSLQDVTGAEFKMFVDFLKSFSIFGDNAPPERIQELIEIIEGQADLDAQFNVSDVDHIDRMISCMFMALPIFVRGASSSRFINYFNKHIIPVFDKLPEERKLDFLKSLAGSSPYATAQDSRQLLPAIVQLLKKAEQQKATNGLRVCNNILIMTQPLHAKSPSFIGDNKINPSWKEHRKVTPTATAGVKRTVGPSSGTGLGSPASKMARGGGMQNQIVNRALEGLSRGGRSSGRGRGFGGRGRGRGYR